MNDTEWQRLVTSLRNLADGNTAVTAAAEFQSAASLEDVPRLIQLLDDESFFVREAAAWALSDLGQVDLLPQLLTAYNRGIAEGHDNDGFSAALIDLVQSNAVESQAKLSSLRRGDNSELRDTSAWLLSFLGEARDA